MANEYLIYAWPILYRYNIAMAPIAQKRYIVELTVERGADGPVGDDRGLSIQTAVYHAISPALVIFCDCTSTGISHIRHRTKVR